MHAGTRFCVDTVVQKERGVNVVVWDNLLDPPVGAASLAWLPDRNELVTAPYVATKALTEATAGAAEIRTTSATVAKHPILLRARDGDP